MRKHISLRDYESGGGTSSWWSFLAERMNNLGKLWYGETNWKEFQQFYLERVKK